MRRFQAAQCRTGRDEVFRPTLLRLSLLSDIIKDDIELARKWLSFPMLVYHKYGVLERSRDNSFVDYGYPLEYCAKRERKGAFKIIWDALEKGKRLHTAQCPEALSIVLALSYGQMH